MPSKSKAQKSAASIAKAIQAGEMPATPGTPSAAMAKMPGASLDEFAKTPKKGLPEHKRGYGASMKHGGHGRMKHPRGG